MAYLPMKMIDGGNSTFKYKHQLLILVFSIVALVSCSSLPAASAPNEPPDVPDPQRTLIRNASLVLTMDPNLGEGGLGSIEGGDVLIDGNTITAGRNLHGSGALIVDATDMIVMPGFVDTHNHLWQSLIRGCAADRDLFGWFGSCELPLLINPKISVSRTESYAEARLSTLDLIDTGSLRWSNGRMPCRPISYEEGSRPSMSLG